MIEYINQTLINAWFLCPERVRRRWMLGDIIPPGIAARIGTGVHKGAEANHKAKQQTGKDEPLDVIQDAARDGYNEAIKEGVFFPVEEMPSAKKQVSEGADTVVTLAKLYHESLAPSIMPKMVEETIELFDPEISLPFKGTLDVATVDKWMPDIKTSAKRWPEQKAHDSVQGTLYNQLYHSHTGEYPKKLSFEILTKTKTPVHQSIETSRTPDDWEVLLLRVQQMIASINAGIFQPAEPGHWTCSSRWCGYFWTCKFIPAHKKILPKRTV